MKMLLLFSIALAAYPQSGIITTFAGAFPAGEGGPAKDVPLVSPQHIAVDKEGNLFVAGEPRIRRISPDGVVTTIIGTGTEGFNGDGLPATATQIATVDLSGIAVDNDGAIVFSDSNNHRIRRVQKNGRIETIAGNGTAASNGDGGPALAASINKPGALAMDLEGSIYVVERSELELQQRVVRKITVDGRITTVAGRGPSGFSGDGGPATEAQLGDGIYGIATDPEGNLYIADTRNHRIRKITRDGTIRTIAGTGRAADAGDGGAAEIADVNSPLALAFDPQGNLYFAGDSGRIRRIGSNGIVSLVAGSGRRQCGVVLGTGGATDLSNIFGLAFISPSDLAFTLTYCGTILKIDGGGNITHLAGVSRSAGDAGPAAFSRLSTPQGVTISPNGDLFVTETISSGVRRFSNGVPSVFAVGLEFPTSIIGDRQGGFLVASNNDRVKRVSPDGKVANIVGTSAGFSGDGGPAELAQINNPGQLAMDSAGNLFIADADNHRIRKVSPAGIVTTFAGTGRPGYSGDNVKATEADLNLPTAVAVDAADNVYIGDRRNARIRRVDKAGIITTVAGNGRCCYSGDGGPAINAALGEVWRLAFDLNGNLLVSVGSNAIRSVSRAGIISTIAGTGVAGLSGDGGPATRAKLDSPQEIAVGPDGALYIADRDNHRIRKILGNVPFLAEPASMVFSFALNAPAGTQAVSLVTFSGEPRDFEVRGGAPWLTVTPRTATFTDRTTLLVTANPAGLAKGAYSTRIIIYTPELRQQIEIPVTMTVSGTPQQLRLSQTGLSFAAVTGNAVLQVQSFRALNAGTGNMPFTIATSTLASGPSWLAASVAGEIVTVRVDHANLAPGAYFGLVTVSAPSADNAPQSAVVVLSVLPASAAGDILVEPRGVIFTTAGPQDVRVANVTARNVNYTSTLTFADGRNWFTVAPQTGTVASGQTASISIRPNVTNVPPGVYRGELALRFTPDNRTIRVSALLIIANTPSADRATTASCAPKSLHALFRTPGTGFVATAGWPVPVEVHVVDNCGRAMTNGRAGITFSNGDAPIALAHTGDGRWTGTWTSHNPRNAGINLTVRAESFAPALAASTQVTGGVNPNPEQPLIAPGGVRSAASMRESAPVAAGSMIAVLGARFIAEQKEWETVPWPSVIFDTRAFVAGRPLPLRMVSDGRIEALLPAGIPEFTTHQLIVQRGRAYSAPEPVLVTATDPAIFTADASGYNQGLVYNEAGELVDHNHPARAGDSVFIHATGLRNGTQVTVQVTIGGLAAAVESIERPESKPGVEIIRARVSEGVEPSASATVFVRVAERESPPVTIAVR